MKLADRIAEICREDICEQNAIRAQVTFRVKTAKSLEGKLKRFSLSPSKNYQTVDEIFAGVSDLAGVRIAAYRLEDCERIVAHLGKTLRGPQGQDPEIDQKDKNRADADNYYRAIHAQVCLPDTQQIGIYDNVGDISCEIQICTMIAHVWNEIEHDIGYKPDLGQPSADEQHYLRQLGRTVRQGDLEISSLLDAYERRLQKADMPQVGAAPDHDFRDQYDFISRMHDFTGTPLPHFDWSSGQLFDLIQDLGLASPRLLHEALQPLDAAELARQVKAFGEYLAENDEEHLAPDPETSDLMLVELLERRLPQILDTLRGRSGRGRGRPTRLHSMALRFARWKDQQ